LAHRWIAALVTLCACDEPSTTSTATTSALDADARTADGHGADVSPDDAPALEVEPVDAAPASEIELASEVVAVDVVLGDPDVLVGAFQIGLVAPVPETASTSETPGSTSIFGKVFDGATPSAIRYHATTTIGDCTLWIPEVPFCAEGCFGGAVCVDADTCQDHPDTVDVGAVVVSGLRTASGSTTISLSAIAGTYQALGPSLPYPAFEEGDVIALTADGGALAPFALSTRGIAPLAVTSSELRVARDTALALTWTTPGDEALARIDVKLDISHHGGTKGVIRCATDDDGALTIDPSLVTALVDLGFSGLPTVVVARRAIGQTLTELGRVELEVGSVVELPVDIPGLVSCTDDEHCPEGQTCQKDLRCE